MKKILTLLFFLLLIPILEGCSDDDSVIPKESLGRWKLELVEYPMVGTFYDYSENNIIIEIKSNGDLIVDEYLLQEESHFLSPDKYAIIKLDSDHSNYQFFSICNSIDCSYWWTIHIVENELTISNSHVDGPIYYFIKN